MPTSASFEVGDFVTCVNRAGNGAGEGVIWRVSKIKKEQLLIVPAWAVTGPSVLRSKWIHPSRVLKFGLPEFGRRIQELTELAEVHLKEKAGAYDVEEEKDSAQAG